MKKAVLREYLKNREEKTLTIHQDKYFTFTVDDADLKSNEDTLGEFIKKAAKEAVEIYEGKTLNSEKTGKNEEKKPKFSLKKGKKGDK